MTRISESRRGSLDYISQVIILIQKEIMCYKILLCIITIHLAFLFKVAINE
ncbi:hypothetical protein NPIL_521391, partial [Nephila pilipes]